MSDDEENGAGRKLWDFLFQMTGKSKHGMNGRLSIMMGMVDIGRRQKLSCSSHLYGPPQPEQGTAYSEDVLTLIHVSYILYVLSACLSSRLRRTLSSHTVTLTPSQSLWQPSSPSLTPC